MLNRNLLALALPLATACGTDPSTPPEQRSDLARDQAPVVADGDFQTFVAGNTDFAFDVYGKLRTTEGGNIFFSPHSITQALGMTYAGANGETATQIADTLHFTLPPAELHASMDKLALALESRTKDSTSTVRAFKLHQDDALWGAKGMVVEQPFLDTLATDYDAGVFELDFAHSPDAATATINSYIKGQTQGTIPDLLQPGDIGGDTRFVLTNAIYFNAAWANSFDPASTTTKPFTTGSGATVQVPTMSSADSVAYGTGADYQAAELDYDGNDISMVVIEPTDTSATGLATFEATLDAARLATILGSMTDSAQIVMPKFSFDAKLRLKQTLSALGMVDAFANADLSGIDGQMDIAITDVVHQGFIAVDEVGTVASGATAVIGAGATPGQVPTMTVDHPYVILIRDKQTGAVLFLGRVVDPS